MYRAAGSHNALIITQQWPLVKIQRIAVHIGYFTACRLDDYFARRMIPDFS